MAKSGFSIGFIGFLIGLVCGLGIAAGAMLLISKSPIPFVDKVDKVTADVDPSQKLSGGVDPNARLNLQSDSIAEGEAGSVRTIQVPDSPTADKGERDAQGRAIEPGQVTPTTFWVQVGAFRSRPDAETSAAKLAMMGIDAKVSSAGLNWRVRVGPFDDRPAAQEALQSLDDQGFEPMIVELK